MLKKKICTVYMGDHERKAEFLGVFQKAYTVDAVFQGQVSGQMAAPVAVILLDGKLYEQRLNEIHDIRTEE